METPLRATRLLESHRTEIWRYLRYLGCDPDEAEDLAQETFLSVLRKPFLDRGRAAASSYLRTVARNLLLNSRRERKIREIPRDAEEVWDIYAGTDGGESFVTALRLCLEGLAPRTREALNLRYRDGKDYEAAAGALGLAREGIKTLLRRAKEHLRDCVRSKLPHD